MTVSHKLLVSSVNLWLRIGVSIPGLLVTRDEAVVRPWNGT